MRASSRVIFWVRHKTTFCVHNNSPSLSKYYLLALTVLLFRPQNIAPLSAYSTWVTPRLSWSSPGHAPLTGPLGRAGTKETLRNDAKDVLYHTRQREDGHTVIWRQVIPANYSSPMSGSAINGQLLQVYHRWGSDGSIRTRAQRSRGVFMSARRPHMLYPCDENT